MNFNTYTNTNMISKRRRRQRLFSQDIEQLLFALGDGPYTVDQTVNALEEALTMYLNDLCHGAITYAKSQGRNRAKADDFAFVLRDDPYKLARLDYIIKQSHKIETSTKMFDTKQIVPSMVTDLINEDKRGRPKKKRKGNAKHAKQNESSDDDDDNE